MRKNESSPTFKEQMFAFHSRIVATGAQLTSYVCPHCGNTIETIQPKKNQVTHKGFWDSLKRCYECDNSSFVLVYPDGKTEVQKLEIEANPV